MKHFVKNLYSAAGPNSVPDFIGQRESILCPFCNQVIVIAVPPTGTDWETVARSYQNYAKQMWTDCNTLLSQAGADTLLQKQLQDILKKCEGLL